MLAVLNGHDKGIIAASYSPDGRQIVTVGGTIVRIWDASSAVLIAELKVKGDNVYNAMFSKDGRYIVAGESTGERKYGRRPIGILLEYFLTRREKRGIVQTVAVSLLTAIRRQAYGTRCPVVSLTS